MEGLVVGIFILLYMTLPFLIQLLLFQIMKRLLKKVPSHVLYLACLLVNTLFLFLEWHSYVNLQSPDDMEPMDAFDGPLLLLMWSPWYIGICISCIVRWGKAVKRHIQAQKNTQLKEERV